jgi:HAMP domain-containing protein
MASEMNHETAMMDLQQGSRGLLLDLATLHTLHAALTIIVLVLALNALWNRTVLRPLGDLLRHINYMGRGSWTKPVEIRSKDEIGELTEAFNNLGEHLTLTVHQYGAVSKLSALALLGQSIVKKALSAAELLRASENYLKCDGRQGKCATDPEPAHVRLAIELLEEIPLLFDKEFQRQLDLHSARPRQAGGSCHGGTRDPLLAGTIEGGPVQT